MDHIMKIDIPDPCARRSSEAQHVVGLYPYVIIMAHIYILYILCMSSLSSCIDTFDHNVYPSKYVSTVMCAWLQEFTRLSVTGLIFHSDNLIADTGESLRHICPVLQAHYGTYTASCSIYPYHKAFYICNDYGILTYWYADTMTHFSLLTPYMSCYTGPQRTPCKGMFVNATSEDLRSTSPGPKVLYGNYKIVYSAPVHGRVYGSVRHRGTLGNLH